MYIVITVLIALGFILIVAAAAEIRQVWVLGRKKRCVYCHARLKRRFLSFADTCSRCGRDQPWAGEPQTMAQMQEQARRLDEELREP